MSKLAQLAATASAPPCCPSLTDRELTDEEAEVTAAMFKALGDPVRLRLFSKVASHPEGEACVCDIADVASPSPRSATT